MKKFLTILFVLNLALIWGNSALPPNKSLKLSNIISNTVYDSVLNKNHNDNSESSNSTAQTETQPDTNENSQVTDLLNNSDKDIREMAKLAINSVRKSAHIIEYMLLAITSTKLLLYCGKINYRQIYKTYKIGIFIAFIDETIQIFSGRTAAIRDIWIDTLGFSIGLLIIIIFRIIKNLKRKKVS